MARRRRWLSFFGQKMDSKKLWPQWVKDLRKEMVVVQKIMMARYPDRTRHAEIRKLSDPKKSVGGAVCADVYFELECKVLLCMIQTVQTVGHEVGGHGYDGLLVYRSPTVVIDVFIAKLESDVFQRLGIVLRIVEKPMSTLITEAYLEPVVPKRRLATETEANKRPRIH